MANRKSRTGAGDQTRSASPAGKTAAKKSKSANTRVDTRVDTPVDTPVELEAGEPATAKFGETKPVSQAATPSPATEPVAPVTHPTAAAETGAVRSGAHEQLEIKAVDGDVQESIRWQAFQIWCERGGDPMENWLEAERRVLMTG